MNRSHFQGRGNSKEPFPKRGDCGENFLSKKEREILSIEGIAWDPFSKEIFTTPPFGKGRLGGILTKIIFYGDNHAALQRKSKRILKKPPKKHDQCGKPFMVKGETKTN